MNAQTKSLLKGIALAGAAFLLVNLIMFGVQLMTTDLSDPMRVSFNNGTFYLNGETKGLIWGKRSGAQFLIGIFLISLILDYKKGLLFNKESNRPKVDHD